jgi:hypothetical protein
MKKLPNLLVSEIKVAPFKYERILPKVGILIIIMIQASCANLYKVTSTKGNSIDTITTLIQSNKQFIIHMKDTSFMLSKPAIFNNMLIGQLLPLNEIQRSYLHPKSTNKNMYTKSEENEVLNEAHVYTTGIGISDSANFSLPATSIIRIDLNQKNIAATKRSHLVGGLIITSAIIGGLVGLGAYAIAHMFDGVKLW